MDRSSKIIKVSITGILVNILLVGFKSAVGFISGSIAIIMDALNNLSDALSLIITIIGTKLANKKPDKEHPYGHGRVEHITAIIIAIIVIIAGVTALKESFEKVIHPVEVNYTAATLIILVGGILTKYFLGTYVEKQGELLYSESLVASGKDAKFDSIISLSTLIAAIIYLIFHISIEGILGVIISIMILKSGIEMLRDDFSSIIGERVDSELTNHIKEKIMEFPEVKGVYDLILHKYGPENMIGSVHIEVDDDMTAKQIHTLTRNISGVIFNEFHIILTVGIYASNNDNEISRNIKNDINEMIAQYPEILQMHGFYVDDENDSVSFDLIFDFKSTRAEEIKNHIIEELKKKYPKYSYMVVLDSDFSED